ncbi:MAG: fimbrillin family protein [Tannerella sp.]|jgi:endonuclease G|nr:fimbrillin family protein [Tannerella sp.]
MKKELVLAAFGAAVFMTSCSNEHEVFPDNTERPSVESPVKFSSSINGATPQTRAGSSTWDAGNTIGIFMVDGTPDIVDYTTNRAYRTSDGSNNFSPVSMSDNVYYPVNGSTVNFISYYPWQTGISLDNLYNVNVVNQHNSTDIDMLYAKTTSGYSKGTSGSVVQLFFDHKLTHMVLNITPGAGLSATDLNGMTVTIKGLNTKTTVDLKDGNLGTPVNVADIVMKTSSNGSKSDAILVPQSIADGGMRVEFKINAANGEETFVWKVPATTFESKKEHVYDVTIARTGISVTGEINPWETGTGGSGNAD